MLEFGTPEPIDELNGDGQDDDPTVRADGLEIFFASNRDGIENIWTATRSRTDDPWSNVEVVPELSSGQRDGSIALSRDARAITIASNREVTPEDIYVSFRDRPGEPWSEPAAISELNSGDQDHSAQIIAGGLAVYFCSDRDAASRHLFRARRSDPTQVFGPAESIVFDTLPEDVCSPWVTEEENLILFRAPEGGVQGSARDLYMAVGERGTFDTPTPLSINTQLSESDPWLVLDEDEGRGWLFFSSEVLGSGEQDLYVSAVTVVD
jgi:hypothetical protein